MEQYLPRVQYVWLERQDIFARTISFYFALQTDTWWLSKDDRGFLQQRKIPFDEGKIFSIYYELLQRTDFWASYLKDREYVYVTYEEVVHAPVETLAKIGKFINRVPVSYDSERVYSQPMTRPESGEYIERLKNLVGVDTPLLKRGFYEGWFF